jgi:uncharacterized protein
MGFRSFAIKHQVVTYFGLTFAISWSLAFLVVAQDVVAGRQISYFVGVLMFPLMIVGPCISGLLMTRTVDGRAGLTDLVSRLRRWKVGVWALPAVVIFPVMILVILLSLSVFVSSVFLPHLFVFGLGFGVIAGFLEEIGWTGYAIRKLENRYSALGSAVLLGLLWGIWHAPVVDFLGAAYPHGDYWLPFFLSFVALVAAVRVLIVWLYTNTGSVLIAQVTHLSSTGFLATLAPVAVAPVQEAGWYALYALVLWVIVAVVVARFGRSLSRHAR